MSTISVVINTLNEEKNLSRALSSVRGFADEVVVVDMFSEDNTCKIAKDFGSKIYQHKRTNYVEPARNFAISKAKCDWVLVLDADEEITSHLAVLLKQLTISEDVSYYRLPRKNIIFGKWIKNAMWWPDYNIRFFKNGCVTWSKAIHSVPAVKGRGEDIKASEEYAIVHHHYNSIDEYLEKMFRYTTAQANDLIEKNYKFLWSDLITKPATEFIRRFYQSSGYKDGLHGLTLSMLQAFSELVVYLKVWQHAKFKQRHIDLDELNIVIRNMQSEKNYWHADAQLKEKGGIIYRVKRKFRFP